MNVCALMLLPAFATAADCARGEPATASRVDTPVGVCTLVVSVSPASVTLSPGDTIRGTVSACPIDGATFGWRWSAIDSTVARVDSLTGLVRARALGKTTIVAEFANDRTVKGAMLVTVVP